MLMHHIYIRVGEGFIYVWVRDMCFRITYILKSFMQMLIKSVCVRAGACVCGFGEGFQDRVGIGKEGFSVNAIRDIDILP